MDCNWPPSCVCASGVRITRVISTGGASGPLPRIECAPYRVYISPSTHWAKSCDRLHSRTSPTTPITVHHSLSQRGLRPKALGGFLADEHHALSVVRRCAVVEMIAL